MNRISLVLTALALQLGAAGQVRAGGLTFNYSGAIVEYTIPVTGTYTITAAGAQGGGSNSDFGTAYGGAGALVSGDVSLTAGTVLEIVVGGAGVFGVYDVGGGGGGGYSGGGFGGGGGSSIAADFTNTSLMGGVNSGDGFVILSIPEPSSLFLL